VTKGGSLLGDIQMQKLISETQTILQGSSGSSNPGFQDIFSPNPTTQLSSRSPQNINNLILASGHSRYFALVRRTE
jgi:hypothetical protein